MTDDFSKLDGLGQANLVKKREVSARELVEAAILRIESKDSQIHALASYDFQQALEKAESELSGPFQGVPFLIKDLIPYPNHHFMMGSRFFAKNIAEEKTPFSNRLDKAGLITLGKTTTSEFGLLGRAANLRQEETRNPWDFNFSATGSSGGSAAAVASGMVPLAHANDGGGSIRIPASTCGVFGFKPGAKRYLSAIPAQNDFSDLVAEHCISRSVRDSACFFSVIENKTEESGFPPLGYLERSTNRPLKIGWYQTTLMGEEPSSDVLKTLHSTVKLCSDLGHELIESPAPEIDGESVSQGFFMAASFTLFEMAQEMEKRLQRPLEENELEPFTLSLIDWYRSLPKDAIQEARTHFNQAGAMMNRYLQQFDVVLCPTIASDPLKLNHLSPKLKREELIRRTEKFAGYTPIHNIAGVPAMSVPLFKNANGLPIGSHFASVQGKENVLFGLAYQLEEASSWNQPL